MGLSLLRCAVAGVAPLLLAACATLPTDRGRDAVAEALIARGTPSPALAEPAPFVLDDALRARLADPLTADAAVEIAWLTSPRAKTALAGLGLAAADLVDAQRPRNPGLSWHRLGSGDHAKTGVGLHLVLTDLVTLPSRRAIGQARWQAAIADTVDALLDEAAEVRRSYWRYVAAEQVADLRDAVAEASALSAEMARRMYAAGNISALQLAREEAQLSLARNDAARARSDRLAARMQLAERLGLAGRSNRWQVPAQLPLPAPTPFDVDALLAQASAQRADLVAARAALDGSARQARLTRGTAWLGKVELGVEREREDGRRASGPSVELELPLFQQGQAARGRAAAREAIAVQRIEALELALQRDIRSLLHRLDTQRDIVATYREALLPQREAIVARQQERYNFMLIGVFELLEARRREFDAWRDYIEAVRDWWQTLADLERAVGTRLHVDATELTPRVRDVVVPPAAEGHHHHH